MDSEEGVISLDGGVWSLDGKEERRKKMERKLRTCAAEEEEEGHGAAKKAQKRSAFSSVAVTDAVAWQGRLLIAVNNH